VRALGEVFFLEQICSFFGTGPQGVDADYNEQISEYRENGEDLWARPLNHTQFLVQGHEGFVVCRVVVHFKRLFKRLLIRARRGEGLSIFVSR
jgi:hypothetical protein